MSELEVYRGWGVESSLLLDALRRTFHYGPGEDRATGVLHGEGRTWPQPLGILGPALLGRLHRLLDIHFEQVAFQAYRNGSGCDWHTDTPFDTQAILSLGASRTFGVRRPGKTPQWTVVKHGDLAVMPSGFQQRWEHCVPEEPAVPGERVSLVFRTAVR
jgi:alkylated DNA repair dioxygenase AlkB